MGLDTADGGPIWMADRTLELWEPSRAEGRGWLVLTGWDGGNVFGKKKIHFVLDGWY